MKRILLLSVLSIGLLSGCSTAFKAGQTPDDVYYSPAREGSAKETAKEEEKNRNQQEQYKDYVSSQDDRYLRMKVANRSRWSSLDNFDYWNDSRYDFCNCNCYGGYNNYDTYNVWNPNWNLQVGYGRRPYFGNYGWNSPIYTLIQYNNPTYGGSTSGSNISAYKNRNYNNSNYGYKDPKTGGFVISGNNNNSFGNLLKRVFTGSSDNSSSSSYDRPQRTFNNSNSNSTPSNPPATSSSAGGNSGGFNSTGTSTSTGRGGKG